MAFGDDWQGVFVRGDDALAFCLALQSLLEGRADVLARTQVQQLWELLHQSDERVLGADIPRQQLKPWEECRK